MRASFIWAMLVAGAVLGPPTAVTAQDSPFAFRPAAAAAEPAASPLAAPAPAASANVPAPFDINGDGRTPAVQEPADAQGKEAGPATTASPLNAGGPPTGSLPVDATNREEREAVRQLLKEPSDAVRELRVSVGNDAQWVDSLVDRPIVPYRALRLDGEIDSAAWNFFITAGEAARGGTLSIAFTNSVLVLPEASRLTLFLNGRQIAQTAIDSPERTKVIALPIAPELLRAGENAIRLQAEMRHRIDCSIDATYELWTRIDTRLTGFSFPGGRLTMTGLADLPGVGVGINGSTRIQVFQADPHTTAAIDQMLRAVQAATLHGRFGHPLVEVAGFGATPTTAPGTLNLLIGTERELRAAMPGIPSAAAEGPMTALVDTAAMGPTLLITGPDQGAVDSALARFEAGAAAAAPLADAAPAFLVREAVPVDSGQSVSLREAGLESADFSGRRFKTGFKISLPPDFYAAAYGEARLYLDGAYAGDVLPGSRLSVMVNGVQSTALILTARHGEVLDNVPVALGMQNFRPGVNTITIAGELLTRSDAACLPGGTVPADDRFALFASTRLVFPDFARIGQLPNLASFAADGFPYGLGDGPVEVHVAPGSLDTIGAAGTLLARVAASRSSPLATRSVAQPDPSGTAGTIVVAPLQDIAEEALATSGLTGFIPPSWRQQTPVTRENAAAAEGLDRYDAVLRRLRQQLRQEEEQLGETPPRTRRSAEAALELPVDAEPSRGRWFNELDRDRGLDGLVADGMRAVREAFGFGASIDGDGDMAPQPMPEGTTLLLAQAPAPGNGKTAWTVVTAPTPSLLSTSVAAVGARANWDRIGGRVTAFDLETNAVETVAAGSVSYLATLPLSFGNLRLIAANWFSLHTAVYALALVGAAVLLGFATLGLVTRVGRRN